MSKIVPLNISTGHNISGGELGAPFACEIQRTKRKTLGIYISHEKVVVRCPYGAGKREVTKFVEDNREWIENRLYEESLRDKELLRIENGGKIFYRARELTITFKEGRKRRVLITGDKFVIQGHKLNTEKAKQQVEDFLTEKASEYLIPRAKGLAKHLGVDHKITQIKLRKTKTKWGHCTSTGIIQYNWMIMLAPYSIIDYMITHEVCHLVHMDHSSRFWNLVESICPNHKEYVEWLKAHEHRYWF
jgi:predicted metal-dependent hydrolase